MPERLAQGPRGIYLDFNGSGQLPASIFCMSFCEVNWVWRNRFIQKVTLNGLYTDCVMHYRAQWLWEHSRGERQRNMAASIRGWARVEKVQEQDREWGSGLGGCQGHLRELSEERDLWRTLLAKPISLCVSMCVRVFAGRNVLTLIHAGTHELTPWRLKYSRVVWVHRFKDQSWSSSTQKIKCFHFQFEMKQDE